MVWGALGGSALVVIISLLMLQKKSAEVQKISSELALTQKERDQKASDLEILQNTFEDQMDEVVQSSIQKISHADNAKEEAIQAAQDNYEAVAEAHALLKEKDALIKQLQSKS